MNSKEIGQRIKNLRIALHLSQEAVADMVGIKQVSYCKYETGETHIFARHLEAIATALGTDIPGLLTSYDFSDKVRVLEDDIKARYDLLLEDERTKVRKLEQTVRDKETIIGLMQDKISFLQKELEKK